MEEGGNNFDMQKQNSRENKEVEEEGKSKSSAFYCRICHDDGDLISPCNCTGSVGLVHLTCLERWLSTDGKSSCEICMYEYQVVRKFKSCSEVIRWKLQYLFKYLYIKNQGPAQKLCYICSGSY